MQKRENTFITQNHSLTFGGSNKILIQSMVTYKTSNIKNVIKQLINCKKAGADLMRVSVLDLKDAKSIKIIKKTVNIPIVADIHYDYKLAIAAIENGADKIRINPGNIENKNEIIKIIDAAKKYDVIIRIGVNSGSLKSKGDLNKEENLVNKALEYIKFFESENFNKIVVSLKDSDPLTTYKAYKLFSEKSNYPTHIGVTESGFGEIGIIRSISGLSPLLIQGIGNTIRISLTKDPLKEIETCKRLLHDLKLYDNYPTIISCPTCGRCKVNNTKKIAKEVLNYCLKNNKFISVAIMGCIVNGIGEGKNADIGIAGGKDVFIIFKKGKQIKTVNKNNVLQELYKEIDTI